ncbi:MAG: DUF4870 domain-containing protein [Candidatus Gracilibacteria bacterium]|nr:DUF4870 domain-containing protein [Candidatus Gracilibacteria bacterium]
MNQEIIQPSKTTDQIKLVGILHFAGNIISGGIFGTALVIIYMFSTNDLQPKTKTTIYNIINFNVSFLIYMIISLLLMFVLIGFITLGIGIIIWFVGLIIGFIKHLSGEDYKYPLAIPFLK